MSTLTDIIIRMLVNSKSDTSLQQEIFEMIMNAPETPESMGLMALMYHEGIGVPSDLDKAFEMAEKAALEGGDALGYLLLGYMCDNSETPDQAEGGPRQKYDFYDAERFYEKCSQIESPWREEAVLWLGDYFMDSTRGEDPEIGIEYYESIADKNPVAAEKLNNYFSHIQKNV